jgi:hypothetical protein
MPTHQTEVTDTEILREVLHRAFGRHVADVRSAVLTTVTDTAGFPEVVMLDAGAVRLVTYLEPERRPARPWAICNGVPVGRAEAASIRSAMVLLIAHLMREPRH